MERQNNFCNRVCCLTVAGALSIVGLIFVLLGLTFLPVIGIVVAIPVFGVSSYFLSSELRPCNASETASSRSEEEAEGSCSWHPGLHTEGRHAA